MADLTSQSKFLSLILRHKPEKGNVVLDKNGWCVVMDLVKNANFRLSDIHDIVRTDDKQRYELSPDRLKIRAIQGHSKNLNIDAMLEKALPAGDLYHGTKEDVKMQIARQGIQPMNRTHVHMTDNLKVAQETADRRKGKSIILVIDAMQMSAHGHKFYKAANGVWLCNEVPPQFITEYKQPQR